MVMGPGLGLGLGLGRGIKVGIGMHISNVQRSAAADKVRVWPEPVLWPKNDRKTNEQNDKMKCINVNLSAGSPRMAKMEVEMEFEMGWRSFGWTCNIALDDDFSVSPATINFSIFLCSRLLLLIVLSAHFTHSLRNTTAHLPGA